MRPTALVILSTLLFSATNLMARVPTSEDFLALKAPGSAEISPDGQRVAYTVLENDFEDDKDMSQLWVVAVDGGNPVQLTYGAEPVGEFEWSPDSRWLAFMRGKSLALMRVKGGEARTPELDLEGMSALRFAPDGSALYFISGPKDKTLLKARKKRYGKYEVYREDGAFRHLWRVPIGDGMSVGDEPKQLTFGRDYSVTGFELSPDGRDIAFTAWISPHLADLLEGRLYRTSANGEDTELLDDSPGVKDSIVWRNDGKQLAYTNGTTFPGYADITIRRVRSGQSRIIEMTELNPTLVRFDQNGVVFRAGERTGLGLYRLNPADGTAARLSDSASMAYSHSFSANGDNRAHIAATADSPGEIVVVIDGQATALTDFGRQLDEFELPTKELISWASYDGLEIEGILTRPVGFEEGKPYPLYIRTHGGPTGTDRPALAFPTRMIYLPEVLAAEGGGALVLQTNYRGSASYGEAFQMSNLRNLGVGPARDIIAGVDKLIEQGLVDPERIACLGWSQGGHISAMLATYSDICTAAIMGAGISDWRTYYYNTDITQFTTEYFAATPLDDDPVYERTSPVSYIDSATTPVLIQHGENDQRVPIANGYQLRQLLLDKGIESRMIVYKGMGHGPSKPRTRRAVNDHALAWFRHYLFGDESPDFVHPVAAESEEP